MDDSLQACFVKELRDPVTLFDVDSDDETNTSAIRSNEFLNLPELATYMANPKNEQFSTRCISICSHNSWRPLQITRPMIDLIAEKHDLDPSFWDLPSCFYSRNINVEDAFCIPYSQTRNGPWIDITYSIRYPEYKPDDDEWVFRQSGLHHRYNVSTHQNIIILLSSVFNSKAHCAMAANLAALQDEKEDASFFWAHEMLCSTYLPTWRRYLAAQERQFLPIANSTFSTYIDEPLRIGFDNLSTLVSLQGRFLKAGAILTSTTDVLDELASFIQNDSCEAINRTVYTSAQLQNDRRKCVGFFHNANHLQQRTEATAQLLANTLSFRDQVIAKEQNGNMLQLNKSAVFITILGLIYVPASFAATFFGMNFFSMDEAKNRIVATSMIWIYAACTCSLTAVSVLFYYWLVQHDSVLFGRIAPRVRISQDWKTTLTRRFTKTNGVELQSLSV